MDRLENYKDLLVNGIPVRHEDSMETLVLQHIVCWGARAHIKGVSARLSAKSAQCRNQEQHVCQSQVRTLINKCFIKPTQCLWLLCNHLIPLLALVQPSNGGLQDWSCLKLDCGGERSGAWCASCGGMKRIPQQAWERSFNDHTIP